MYSFIIDALKRGGAKKKTDTVIMVRVVAKRGDQG